MIRKVFTTLGLSIMELYHDKMFASTQVFNLVKIGV